LGLDHPETLVTMGNLGVNYRDARLFSEAIALLEEGLDRARQRPGGVPAQLAWLPTALANTYAAAGHFAKAEPLYHNALEQAKKQFGAGSLRIAGPMYQLGLNLMQQKKYHAAELLLRDCLQICEREQPNVWNSFNIKSMLGGSLLGQKRYADAETFLLQGYEGMKQREVQIPKADRASLSEALDRLIDLYDAWGKKDAAAKWRALRT
jgi:eukaryotic-like serine/threonine-protein kinase